MTARAPLGQLALVLLAVALGAMLAATSSRARAEPRVDRSTPRLVITGDSTLSPEVIARLAGIAREPALAASVIRKRLLDTNLFSLVTVARTREVVRIRLRQKITWFVLPYVSSDPSGTYYSLAAGRAVIAHEDVFAFAWYQAGTGDHEGRFGLHGRNILGSSWDAGMDFEFRHSPQWVYSGREIVGALDNESYGGNLTVGYRFGLPWTITLANYVEHHRFGVPTGGVEEGLQWSHKLELEYDRYYVIDGLGQGQLISGYFEGSDPIGDFRFYKLGAAGKIGVFQAGDFAWIMRPSFDYGFELPFYQLFDLGGMSLRGYSSQQFSGNYDLAVLNDVYLQSWNFWIFKTRPLLFADWAFIDDSAHPSAGGGIQFGVRDLLLSAVQVVGGYGFNPAGFSVVFSIGQSF